MSSPFADQLADAFGALREHQQRIQQARQELLAATISVTSKDRMVTAKVGGRGELHELKFHTDAYRSMAPAELSGVLVQVVNDARERMATKVADTFAPFTGFGAEMRESLTGGTELEDVLAPLRAMRPFGDESKNADRVESEE